MSARNRTRLICLVVLTLAGCLPAATASASKSQETIFEDDTLLTGGSDATAIQTLDTIKSLGVDRIRVLMFWNRLAFMASSTTRPTLPNPDDPADYEGWDRNHLKVREAGRRGIGVDLDFAPPAPRWAVQATSDPQLADHYKPNADDFRHFAAAVGTRYSGNYTPLGSSTKLPRVSFWSIWNEPNEWHFLAPQFASSTSPVEQSAAMYRALVDGAYTALSTTGHSGDVILIGETAPQGTKTNGVNLPGSHHSLDPMRFLRALYCVDRKLKSLSGSAAQALNCPTTGAGRASFASDHPGLFQASGWGHHPYALASRPNSQSRAPDDVKLGDLPRITNALRSAFGRYGRGNRGLPVYLTEFGFQTRPPDPFGLAAGRQGEFINQSEFTVYSNPRVRSYSQFLLEDDPPDTNQAPSSFFYWNTFQTGLEWGPLSGLEGRLKPGFSAFRIPIFVPVTKSRRAATFRVWGGLRPAPNGTFQSASIQFKGRTGPFKQIKRATTTNFRGYIDAKVRITRSGQLRIVWTDASGTTLFSRNVGVKVGR